MKLTPLQCITNVAETVLAERLTETIVNRIAHESFDHYAAIVYVTDAQVV